ncbi:histidine-phosphotransfer domain, HPT domain-containing protein [Artomyces pyxidatus]|uniref:Histidine-phosphotransfer domain, HPT domain-containing protein n=1 Tax=Artomyces pyxidatus TaxID=48021 RepID=A0ACB8SYV9_9AGAM|nr:histidine-phosphotransfer domain, HPT domain-containing protein [Artomyces pyxidatus]
MARWFPSAPASAAPLSPSTKLPIAAPPAPSYADEPSPAAPQTSSDAGVIDIDTFNQILDLDEDDTHDFSKGMAWAYFSQVGSTFDEMDEALADKDLPRLSSLGHFLKGSSAALGVSRVQASCEQIQHYGHQRDEEHDLDLDADVALNKIAATLGRVKLEYVAAEKWLRGWYADNGGADSPLP